MLAKKRIALSLTNTDSEHQKSRAVKCVGLLRSLEFRIFYLQERPPPQEMGPAVGIIWDVRNATPPEPPSYTTSKPVRVAKFLIFQTSRSRKSTELEPNAQGTSPAG